MPSVLFARAADVAHAQTQPELRFLNGALTIRSKHGRFDANRVILLCFVEQPKDSGWRFLGNVRDKMAVWVYRMYLDSADTGAEEGRYVHAMNKLLYSKGVRTSYGNE